MKNLEKLEVIRQARKRIIVNAINQELAAETFEGMAEYAGLMALRQISQEKFAAEVEKQLLFICNPENLFDTRRVSYFVGSIICMTLKSLGIDFHHELSETRPLFDLIQLNPSAVEISLNEFQQSLSNRFDSFRKQHSKKVEVDALITGFDPMNMVRLGDEFLCKHFVVLDGEFIQGPVLLEMEEGSLRRVRAYIT